MHQCIGNLSLRFQIWKDSHQTKEKKREKQQQNLSSLPFSCTGLLLACLVLFFVSNVCALQTLLLFWSSIHGIFKGFSSGTFLPSGSFLTNPVIIIKILIFWSSNFTITFQCLISHWVTGPYYVNMTASSFRYNFVLNSFLHTA